MCDLRLFELQGFIAFSLPKGQNANPQGNALGQVMILILLPEGQQQQKVAHRICLGGYYD